MGVKYIIDLCNITALNPLSIAMKTFKIDFVLSNARNVIFTFYGACRCKCFFFFIFFFMIALTKVQVFTFIEIKLADAFQGTQISIFGMSIAKGMPSALTKSFGCIGKL